MTTRAAAERHDLLGKLATVQARLHLLELRTAPSPEQRELVRGALDAVYELADLIRAAFPEAVRTDGR